MDDDRAEILHHPASFVHAVGPEEFLPQFLLEDAVDFVAIARNCRLLVPVAMMW
ncbi:MAG: hypothetical protein R3B96_10155 [Pirellulaceae bacterium]